MKTKKIFLGLFFFLSTFVVNAQPIPPDEPPFEAPVAKVLFPIIVIAVGLAYSKLKEGKGNHIVQE